MFLPEIRPPGVSFVVRARNEAEALLRGLLSLRPVRVPYEIVLVLHRCTDASKAAALACIELGMPIRLVEDETRISRAGYETLVTPADHFRSLPSFYNRAFERARYNWIVKWDADFVATDYLLRFLNNECDLASRAPTAYRLSCALGDAVISREEYMFNTCLGYDKYFYWEACRQVSPRQSVVVQATCMTSLPPTVVKSYWRETPWFLQADNHNDEIAYKYHKLVEILGPEPVGLARSNNPEFDAHWRKLTAVLGDLAKHGIDPQR